MADKSDSGRRKKGIKKIDGLERRANVQDRRVDKEKRQLMTGLYENYKQAYSNVKNPKTKKSLGDGLTAMEDGERSGEAIAVGMATFDAQSEVSRKPKTEHEFVSAMQEKGDLSDSAGNIVSFTAKSKLRLHELYWSPPLVA